MRGRHLHLKTFNLFEDQPNVTTKLTKQGRSADLILQRNKKIVYRYYFKAKIQQTNYDNIIRDLKIEFDLSNERIAHILFNESADFLKEVLQHKPDPKELRNMYPYLVW